MRVYIKDFELFPLLRQIYLFSVDSTKEMIGTFSPQPEVYTHVMPEETTPSGMFARGTYSARSKVIPTGTSFFSYKLTFIIFQYT